MKRDTHASSVSVLKMKKATIFLSAFLAIISLALSAPCAISDYAGTYSGTFSGGDAGIWMALVEANGNVNFICWSNSLYEPDGSESMSVDESGNISGTTDNGSFFYATIDPSGDVSGTWSGGGNNGTLTGDKCNATILSDLSGTYEGSVSGDASGSFSIVLNSIGHVTGNASVEGDKYSIEGGFDDQGNIILDIGGDAGLKGTVFLSGSVNGNWYHYYEYASGTFSGSKTSDSTDSGGDGDGGGGGGCFIELLSR